MTHRNRMSLLSPRIALLPAAAALLALGCGDDAPGTRLPDPTPPSDTGSGAGDTGDDGASDDAGPSPDDAGARDTTPTPDDSGDVGDSLGLGDICLGDEECTSQLCFGFDPTIDEGFCSQLCLDDAGCPDDFRCVFLQNSGGDFTRLCVPRNLCLDRDEDGYGVGPGCLGPDCDDDNPDINPGAPEICDGLDNNCNGNIDENPADANQPCVSAFPGVCEAGITRCMSGLLTCEQEQRARSEICDGLDNDCDGAIDEGEDGEPIAVACYGGVAATRDVGLCTGGVRTCTDGEFGDCEGQILPAAEICDGLDNDCDGSVDEDAAAGGFVCATGELGVCATGTTLCTDEGSLCRRNIDPSDEICDGLDNDCDGAIDEGPDGQPLRRDCYSGDPDTRDVGVCTGGTQVCGPDGFGRCLDEVRPSTEICDGLDNDCDGSVDEGNPGGGVVCSTGLAGVCSAGVTVCGDDGELLCEQTVFPSAEVCDGFDNDCNGLTDDAEDGRPLTLSCYDGDPATRDRGECASGVRTCTGGAFGSCVGQVLPGREICDGLDNNCDGTPDDGDPGGGIPCSTGESGVCAAGVTACTPGGVICRRTAEPEAEICDGIDNDCDGTIDEGFPGLGEPCLRGQGICQSPGVVVCAADRTAPPVCNAPLRTGNPTELCDYVDDDCDGQVDEGFVDASGRYITLAHCGACGFDCNQRWIGGAALYHVVPTCTPTATSAACGFVCEDGWVDADGIEDNGCELRPEPGTIYVATPFNGGVDESGCGPWDRPCATLQNAIDLAASTGRTRVRVSSGLYRENLTLRNGVSVLGGHSHINWTRNPDIFGTTLRGADAGPGNDRIVVRAHGITAPSDGAPTEFSGFNVVGVAAGPGGNSIAISIVDSNQNLRITQNEITAGNGGAGVTGTSGAGGTSGTAGSPGAQSVGADYLNSSFFLSGGSGGTRSCPGGVNVNGGRGGHGLNPTGASTSTAQPSGPGVAGSGPSGGAGGRAGIHMWNNDGLCSVPGPTDGSPGIAGTAGTDGSGGARAADTFGTFSGGQWRGTAGGAGTSGAAGSGGGGGGSSGGLYRGLSTTNHVPPSGGGGGSGGCPGTAGSAGTPGGGSFGIFLAFTGAGPANASQMPSVRGNRIRRGLGGRGGDGGTGGGGGEGGPGAAGGAVNPSVVGNFCLVDASPGGVGGRGGHGGGGAGGTGGVSYDIWAWNTNAHDGGYSDNVFEISNATSTSGAGGTGGNSSNTATGTGQNGLAGASGQVRLVP